MFVVSKVHAQGEIDELAKLVATSGVSLKRKTKRLVERGRQRRSCSRLAGDGHAFIGYQP